MYYALVSAALVLTLMPFKTCCARPRPKVPKTSDGCYAWSHYGGGCEVCKTNWNDCKCKKEVAPQPEVGCETCMRFLSECECAQREAHSESKWS